MVTLTALGRGELNARHPPGSPPRW
jgi:hypothetical protein